MPYPAAAFDDVARVAALRRYGELDETIVADFNSLARLAATICGASMAGVNLTDEDRVLVPGSVNLPYEEMPRKWALCEPVIRRGQLFHTDDLPHEDEWLGHKGVQAEPTWVRMYAAAPLITPDGHAIGTMCVMDEHQRQLEDHQLAALQDLADTAVHLLEARMETATLEAAIDELAVSSARDLLTGVATREQLLVVLDHSAAEGLPHTVLFCDLDGFKPINDNLGHRVGDAALAAVGARLAAAARPDDVVARIGGDEFVVVVAGDDPSEPANLAARIEDLVARPIQAAGHEVHLTMSVGWAASEPGLTPADLLANADAAMYATKAARRSPAAG